MNFVFKTRIFALKTRNCVSKTRNVVLKTRNYVSKTRTVVLKMMNFAGALFSHHCLCCYFLCVISVASVFFFEFCIKNDGLLTTDDEFVLKVMDFLCSGRDRRVYSTAGIDAMTFVPLDDGTSPAQEMINSGALGRETSPENIAALRGAGYTELPVKAGDLVLIHGKADHLSLANNSTVSR